MKSVLKDAIQSKVREFLCFEVGISNRKIHLQSSLVDDLHVAGSDGSDLLEKYSRRFNVSIDGVDLVEIFGRESSMNLNDLCAGMNRMANYKSAPRITVEDLVNGVRTGKLEIQK